jgi:hypothetical protein
LLGKEMSDGTNETVVLRGHPQTVGCNDSGVMVTIFLRKDVCDGAPFVFVYGEERTLVTFLSQFEAFFYIDLNCARCQSWRRRMIGDADFRSTSEDGNDGRKSDPYNVTAHWSAVAKVTTYHLYIKLFITAKRLPTSS